MTARHGAASGTQRGPPPAGDVTVTSHAVSRPAAVEAMMRDTRTGSGGEAARVMDGPAARPAALRNTGRAGDNRCTCVSSAPAPWRNVALLASKN
jgi:hypothetical protein